MDTWDHEPRVRPIPIDDEDAAFWAEAERSSASEHWTRRPWLPIALSAVAVVGVLSSVTVFGALERDDPIPPLDALPFSNTRSLQEIIPGLNDRLTLVVVGPNGPATLLWDPSLVDPRIVELQHPTEDELDYEASFDSSGRFVAVSSILEDAVQPGLRIGIPTDLGVIDLEGIDSYQWHASEVGHLAFVQTDASGPARLITGVVDPLSRLLVDVTEIVRFSPTSTLIRWDTTGFILSHDESGSVTAIDETGVVQWSEPGVAVATSGRTVLIAPAGSDRTSVDDVSAFTRTGERTGTILPAVAGDGTSARMVMLSTNSDLMARLDLAANTTTIAVDGPQAAGTVTVQHEESVSPLGFTSNDAFFVFASNSTNNLIFVNWEVGAVHEVDVPDGFEVIGFDIG